MDRLEVIDSGLGTLATHCQEVSAGLTAATPAPRGGPPLQATSAAVSSGYAGLGVAAAVLVGRVEVTGAKLLSTGTSFDIQDDTAAQRLAAVDNSIQV